MKPIPVLMYHSLDTARFQDKTALPAGIFEKQMRFLSRHFSVIPLEECALRGCSQPLWKKQVAVTFDDGYADNFTHALPVLKRLALPATFFVSADKIGEPGYLDWTMLKEMSRIPGIVIGSHGTGHMALAEAPPAAAERSIQISKKILEEGLGGRKCRAFSYPSGSFNRETMSIVKRAGYQLACAASHVGDRNLLRDPFAIRRIKISSTSGSNLSFVFRLSGFYNLFRRP